jgi:hypothetical protein
MNNIVFDNTFWSYTYYPSAEFTWLKRTSKKYQSLEEITASVESLREGIQRVPAGSRLLSDLRAGPPLRNDPGFEAAILPIRVMLAQHFGKQAVLVKTAVGVLQINRHNKTDQLEVAIFQSEADAFASLDLTSFLSELST